MYGANKRLHQKIKVNAFFKHKALLPTFRLWLLTLSMRVLTFLPLMNFTAAGSTHVGLVRKKNEDSFL